VVEAIGRQKGIRILVAAVVLFRSIADCCSSCGARRVGRDDNEGGSALIAESIESREAVSSVLAFSASVAWLSCLSAAGLV